MSNLSDRRLTHEATVTASVEDVWHAWTTNEGLRFVSNHSNVELRLGGAYEWFLDLDPDAHGKRGGEGARVLAYLPHEMLAFDWTFPPDVPSLRSTGARTQVVVFFEARGSQVHVRLVQHGWRAGDDWDAGFAYFDRAWGFVLQRLVDHFADRPGR